LADRHNKLQQILSPNPEDPGVWIHQDAWFHIGNYDDKVKTTYAVKKESNGVYAFVLKGSFLVNGELLASRDGMGVWNTSTLNLQSQADDAEILLMEVPMQLPA
jgi:redox-sensitive bicupin YhaK (pirin superfamily)